MAASGVVDGTRHSYRFRCEHIATPVCSRLSTFHGSKLKKTAMRERLKDTETKRRRDRKRDSKTERPEAETQRHRDRHREIETDTGR